MAGCGGGGATGDMATSSGGSTGGGGGTGVLHSVALNWQAPTTNTDGSPAVDLSGYKIYYGTSAGSYPNSVDAGSVTTYTFNNLSAGTTYYFVITAYDSSGVESDPSVEVSKAI